MVMFRTDQRSADDRFAERQTWQQKRKHDAEDRQLAQQRRAQGLLEHPINPADPWSETVWRRCDPDCPQHGGNAA